MIRSTRHTIKYANTDKRTLLVSVIQEYRRLAQAMIDWFWAGNFAGFVPGTCKLRLPKYPSSEVANQFDTWLTARMRQCVAKQVIGMLNAAVAKQRKRMAVLRREQRKEARGKKTKYKRLQSYVDRNSVVKPSAAKINMELDSRFVDFEDTPGEFDLFVRLSSIGNKISLKIPLQHHTASRKWEKKGTRKKSIRVSEKNLCLFYEVDDPPRKKRGRVLGCDQGYLTVASLADQNQEHVLATPESCVHGHTLKSICSKIARKVPRSKAKQRALEHRRNFINWSLNTLNFAYVKGVRLERIKHLRKGKKQYNKSLMHWTYTQIRRKLEALAEEKGFLLQESPNVYKSQRCSQCGWVLKTNRVGKTFTCGACGFTSDADLNAASNHAFDLPEVPYGVRQQKMNRKGFYYLAAGLFSVDHEPIVRGTPKAECSS